MGEKLFPFEGEIDLAGIPAGRSWLIAVDPPTPSGQGRFYTDTRTVVVGRSTTRPRSHLRMDAMTDATLGLRRQAPQLDSAPLASTLTAGLAGCGDEEPTAEDPGATRPRRPRASPPGADRGADCQPLGDDADNRSRCRRSTSAARPPQGTRLFRGVPQGRGGPPAGGAAALMTPVTPWTPTTARCARPAGSRASPSARPGQVVVPGRGRLLERWPTACPSGGRARRPAARLHRPGRQSTAELPVLASQRQRPKASRCSADRHRRVA